MSLPKRQLQSDKLILGEISHEFAEHTKWLLKKEEICKGHTE
jgi:hypothetical protein